MKGRRSAPGEQPAPRRRGRPAAVSFSPDEVAAFAAVPLARVATVLRHDRARPLFFPGAWHDGQGWRIPERDLKALLGPKLQGPAADAGKAWKLYPVAEFADLIGFATDYVYELIERGVITARKVLGQLRISAQVYYTLPAERPAAIPPRPASFFSRKSAVSGINSERQEVRSA
jgi:hypothetical protein